MNRALLKAKMAERDVNQRDMAKALRMHDSAVSLKLRGKRKMTIEDAEDIARWLELEDEEIIRIFFNT